MKIRIVPYKQNWPADFEKEAQALKDILKENLINIFHIGSTAVPGLAAKPIIDIMPVVRELKKVDLKQRDLEDLAYEYMGELGIKDRRYLRKGGENRTHQVHIFQFENTKDILRHLAFRDFLRSHPEKAEKYAELKKIIAKKYPDNIDGYSDAKNDFVKRLEKEALIWFWSLHR